ncbi:hypothetical protein BT96DRAFT_791205, partial [Gymnopus androsaceus JB14]
LKVGVVARRVARAIWNETGFRFRYKTVRKDTTNPEIQTFQFYCAQYTAEQSKPKLHEDPRKHRARDKMDRYDCGGYLRITMQEGYLRDARIHFSHHTHTPYVSISITPEQLQTIREMRNQSPSKIWDHILQQDPETELTEKQIQAEW